jgi:predicted CXXCH cytochrome family protein
MFERNNRNLKTRKEKERRVKNVKQSIRLYLITAFLVLMLPMVLTIASPEAAATWFLNDGSSLKDNGSWQVTDPGACRSNGAKTIRADCNAEVFWQSPDPDNGYGTQGGCTGASFCTDLTSGNQTDCTAAGYVWTTQRVWQVTKCVGNYTSTRLYGNASTTDPYFSGSSRQDCLHCHNDNYGTHALPDGHDRYFMSGHKNILRKVMPKSDDSASIPLGGPFFTAGLTTDPYSNIVWSSIPAMSGTNSVYYIYNSWFSAIKTAQMNGTPYANLTDPTSASTIVGTPTTSHWSCLYCHTGYYGADPDAPYPLVTETTAPSNCGDGTQPCGFEAGITCLACHNEYPSDPVLDHHTRTTTGNYASAPEYEEITALCVKCHRAEEQGPPETPGFEPLAVEELANHHGNFGGQFVNSPHARFSGDYAQLGEWDKYDSDFATMGDGCSDPQYHIITTCTDNGGTWGTVQHNEGCTGCHNPHVGAVDPDVLDPTSDLSQIQATCAGCHTEGGDADATQVDLATINHPGGTDSPLENIGTDKGKLKACVSCHMGPELTHFFRINAGGDYSTFESLCTNPDYETRTTCTNNGETWSNMSVEYGELSTYDEDGFDAVGLDVNWACGSCHYDSEKVGSKVFDKAQLSAAALGMHSGGSTTNTDCLACHSSGVDGAPTITPGTNHHGVHSKCSQCHPGGHNSPLPDKHSNTFCLGCHTNTGSHGNHHSVPGLPAECVSCHTTPGFTVPPMGNRDEVVAGCTSCHTDKIASGTGDNHHRGHGPSDEPLDGNACQGCHSDNGGKSTTQVSTDKGLLGNEFQDAGPEGTITATSKLCVVCHSEIDHGHGNFIQSGPNQNHHKGNCCTCHHSDGSHTDGAPGAGVTSPSPATVVNCTITCHANITNPCRHNAATCETCHEHPGAGVLPLNIQDACGQCHGGGTSSTENPPLEGIPYMPKDALESLAYMMHANGTSIIVNVTYSTDAPLPGATVKLLKKTASGWVQIQSGMTDSSGRRMFPNLVMNNKYKVVVVNSSVDFNGAVTGKQKNVKFGSTDPKTAPVKLTHSATINVQQGTPATNGTKGWNGDNGSLPTITITMP